MSEAAPVVVVGVDGSESSIEALKWAARYAERFDGTLRVITAWPYPEQPTPFGIVPEFPSLGADPLTEAADKLHEVVSDVLGPRPSVPARTDVEPGLVSQVLIHASQEADLLVVGSRGRGAFTGMLLGSVSEHCVHHARCPVVVVRSHRSHPT